MNPLTGLPLVSPFLPDRSSRLSDPTEADMRDRDRSGPQFVALGLYWSVAGRAVCGPGVAAKATGGWGRPHAPWCQASAGTWVPLR
jgi:hypothetical protein